MSQKKKSRRSSNDLSFLEDRIRKGAAQTYNEKKLQDALAIPLPETPGKTELEESEENSPVRVRTPGRDEQAKEEGPDQASASTMSAQAVAKLKEKWGNYTPAISKKTKKRQESNSVEMKEEGSSKRSVEDNAAKEEGPEDQKDSTPQQTSSPIPVDQVATDAPLTSQEPKAISEQMAKKIWSQLQSQFNKLTNEMKSTRQLDRELFKDQQEEWLKRAQEIDRKTDEILKMKGDVVRSEHKERKKRKYARSVVSSPSEDSESPDDEDVPTSEDSESEEEEKDTKRPRKRPVDSRSRSKSKEKSSSSRSTSMRRASSRQRPSPKKTQSHYSPSDTSVEEERERAKTQKRRSEREVTETEGESERESTPPDPKRRRMDQGIGPNIAVLEVIQQVTDYYVERGYKAVEEHQMFQTMDVDLLHEILLVAMNRDAQGYRPGRALDKEEKKWVSCCQEEVTKAAENVRQLLPGAILEETFGLKAGLENFSLWEKVNLVGLCARESALSVNAMTEIIKKKAQKLKSITAPGPWTGGCIAEVTGPELQLCGLAEIVKVPTKWKEFIQSTKEHGANWRELMAALSKKYLRPHESMRGDRMAMQQVYEIKEHLWEIEFLLSPSTLVDVPKKVEETHNTLLLHKLERLEALRLFLKDPRIAVEFQKLARVDQPSKTKDLKKIELEAEKEAKKLPERKTPVRMKGVNYLAHTSRSLSARPGPSVSFSASQSYRREMPRVLGRESSAPRPHSQSTQSFRRASTSGRGPPRRGR